MPYIIAAVVIIVLGVGFTLFGTNKPVVEAPTTQTPLQEIPANSALYKNGLYTTVTTYRTPKQTEYQLNVALTITDDIVTDAVVTYSQGAEKDPNAKRFEDAYKAEVIGKSLDGINLSRVGGASLTTNAFNKALTEIKKQAQS